MRVKWSKSSPSQEYYDPSLVVLHDLMVLAVFVDSRHEPCLEAIDLLCHPALALPQRLGRTKNLRGFGGLVQHDGTALDLR